MSSAAVKWAKRQKIDDRTLSAILIELASAADAEGRCEVTQAKLARSLGMAARTIERSMPLLEGLGLFARSRQHASQRRGRAADLITLAIDKDFSLPKEKIMGVKHMGPNRQNVGMNRRDQTDKMSGGPKSENAPRHIEERARGVLSPASPSNPHRSVGVSSRVRFDRQRNSWRASLTVDGVTMELGRFDTQAEADAYAAQAVADVRRTSTMKAGTPSFPVVSPSKANLDAPSLGAWLFGEEGETTDDDGVGEAGALGQGAKLLAGLGGAHEALEYDAARACATTVVPFRGRAA